MLLLLLEKGMPLDEVIFYNSEMEFQAIYDIRDRMEAGSEQGASASEVKPDAPFCTICWRSQSTPEKMASITATAGAAAPCRWGTKLKMNALDSLALDAEKALCWDRRG